MHVNVIDYAAKAMLLVLYLSLPPILAAAIVGTLVSLFQALTQIQEQTLSFSIKLIAVMITIFLTARWLGQELLAFAIQLFDGIPRLV
jgi:type III secretion protein S